MTELTGFFAFNLVNSVNPVRYSFMFEIINNWLVGQGIELMVASTITRVVLFFLVIALSILANYVTKHYILRGLAYSIGRTETKWDDIILEKRTFTWLSHLVPALVIYVMAPAVLEGHPQLIKFTTIGLFVYVTAIIILTLDSLLTAILSIYETLTVSKEIPLKVFIQVIKIVVYFVGGIVIISIIFDKTVLYLFSGLGAMTAVLMLVFKDSIMGLVAGIQLTANKMVARGDWIEMPKYGANGDVLEVALTTVKVQNFDKTITTIPTYALIGESFKNWRGMSESGGRRIKRSINLDVNTIKLCTAEMLERFSKIQYISAYIKQKKEEVAEYNATHQIDASTPVNGRRLTNIGTFRAYTEAYLKNHPMINQDMTILVRQLPLTEHGVAIEVYAFSKDKVWANYEAIQADIFDHLLAVVPEFDLRVFQSPTGHDFGVLISVPDKNKN
ncbi:mechanosensitive ion channel family protein [Anaerolineales bacterium HSG25]|nr:mechanosensitive ion channel family protein [Anaerolineales bacterium HSG25]